MAPAWGCPDLVGAMARGGRRGFLRSLGQPCRRGRRRREEALRQTGEGTATTGLVAGIKPRGPRASSKGEEGTPRRGEGQSWAVVSRVGWPS
ncbi:hypothetical protein TRIUR3_32199 [Triticum urartu]|uniref:Uncharacterized protein n=1 Tax=Triticum urartu TaxID=4572 RepID=M8A2C5_TRIUA|nr:hypothetical protein TRIUR3_32199 [Triticum urartu]